MDLCLDYRFINIGNAVSEYNVQSGLFANLTVVSVEETTPDFGISMSNSSLTDGVIKLLPYKLVTTILTLKLK